MTNEIYGIWREIENWVKNEYHTEMNPPLQLDQILKFENNLGMKLPSDFIESLAIHDGCDYLEPCEGTLLTAEEIIETISIQKETMLDIFGKSEKYIESINTDPRIQRTYWSVSWIPFFRTDWSVVCIDLAPTQQGTPGQIIEVELETGDLSLVSESYLNFLRSCLEKMSVL